MEQDQQIYQVTTEGDVEGRSTRTLGYATGDRSDIIRYFDDRKTYQLYLTPINVIKVTKLSSAARQRIKEDIFVLETQLKEAKQKLENL